MRATFAYIWEYMVEDDQVAEFQRIYGPEGEWVDLFSKEDGYIRTDLYRDLENPQRFVTTDFWVSRAAKDQHRESFASEFAELDRHCEALTLEEKFLGDFELVVPKSGAGA
ncbi:antibiotic biosynthesis monooxygenase [bacterium]|nr:antibiotic biosynthesis monooxygenase [bacterium]